MPLTPATTDLFQKVGLPGSATTLASPGYTIGNTGVTVGSTTNHPTDTLYTFAIDRAQTVNGVTSRIAGTYCEFEGIVASGTTITSMVLKYGTAQNYPAGSFTRVYIPVSSNRENQLIVGLRQDHNGKGNHQTLTDDNGNPWLTRSQVASAVNNLQATNAATGGIPRLDAIGSDTNIPLYLGGKGTEPAHAENSELVANFVVPSTGVIAQSSGLIGTFSNMVFYSNAKRYKKTSVANKTYTASKDTYVDADPSSNGTLTYTEVANGAAAPALTSGYVRVAKVVTGASAITTITQDGRPDSLGNLVYCASPYPYIIDYAVTTVNNNVGVGAGGGLSWTAITFTAPFTGYATAKGFIFGRPATSTVTDSTVSWRKNGSAISAPDLKATTRFITPSDNPGGVFCPFAKIAITKGQTYTLQMYMETGGTTLNFNQASDSWCEVQLIPAGMGNGY